MNFLADMGISFSTTLWLKNEGHDCVHLRDQGLQKISDAKITAKAKQENRVILTCDLDFGDIMAASGEVFPSVIIFRLADETPVNINKRLADVLKQSGTALEEGAIVSVEETRHRVRVLPV